MIPYIIHFTAKDFNTLHKLHKYCIFRWKAFNGHHKFYYHDNNTGLQLIKQFDKRYADLYIQAPGIIKSQFIRYAAMLFYGGIYADIDLCPFSAVDRWNLDTASALILVSSNNCIHDFQFHSDKDHSLWREILYHSLNRWDNLKNNYILNPITLEQKQQNMGIVFDCCSVSALDDKSKKYTSVILKSPQCDQHICPWQNQNIFPHNLETFYTFHYAAGSWCESGRSLSAVDNFITMTDKYFPV